MQNVISISLFSVAIFWSRQQGEHDKVLNGGQYGPAGIGNSTRSVNVPSHVYAPDGAKR
jgi:hypothetical protein